MNEPLIFDTSVWIDFLRKGDSPAADLLTSYLEHNDQIFLTPTIIQEILQGIRADKQHQHIKEVLSYFSILQFPPAQAAIESADLYRSLRKKGVTIRKSNDCLIAFFAIEFSIPLVHLDSDFDLISQHSNLKIWQKPKRRSRIR